MFNIRNLVNRISQVKDGEVSDTSSNRSRSLSQGSNLFSDDGASVEAEGFLCPTCFVAFPSADDLQSHYKSVHLEPGANYLCPVCKARLNTASDLELHYSSNHSSSSARVNGDVDSLVRQITELHSSLSEEKWNSEELRKEVSLLKEMVKAQGTGEEHQMYQEQLEGLQETKTLLTSEIVLIRKQLAEALEFTLALKQDRERLKEKAAKSSQTVAELQATLDEHSGLTVALRENIQQLEAELEHNLDDAKLVKQELSSVQRLMDEMNQAKVEEKSELQKQLDELHLKYDTLKEESSAANDSSRINSNNKVDDHLSKSIEQFEVAKLQMEVENHRLTTELAEMKRAFIDKSEQLNALQHQREETDVCVGHLREEVTSLQDMLDLARQSAEGQVLAKEDELCSTKVELMKHQQQNTQLDSRCKDLEKANDQLSQSISILTKDTEEHIQSLKQMKGKIAHLEEKIERMETEKAELMVTIQKGEGFDTAIQQLQQDNTRLHQELTKSADEISAMENRHKEKSDKWSRENIELKEELKQIQETLGNLSNELEQTHHNRSSLQSALDQSAKTVEEWKKKYNQLETKLHEMEKKTLNLTSQIETENGEALKLQQELKVVTDKRIVALNEIEKLTVNLKEAHLEADKLKKSLNKLQDDLAKSNVDHQEEMHQLNRELVHLKTAVAVKEKDIENLKEHIAELEPLTEVLEEQKLLRIREKAEWGEHEQLLTGEKESLSTLSTHLKQQLDEQLEEHKIFLHRFKTETDALIRDKNLLSELLNAEKEKHSKDNSSWIEKHAKLEENLKFVTEKLGEAEELSSVRNHRCEELQASTEKYHSLKIELEARVELLLEEKANLQNNNNQWETEVDRLKFNGVELRRRLEDSQAALHELGRENQSLQMENAKLQGRKWADDSEVDECLSCQKGFNLTVRKHHCRNCGQIFCNECSAKATTVGNSKKQVRVCDPCFKELNNAPR